MKKGGSPRNPFLAPIRAGCHIPAPIHAERIGHMECPKCGGSGHVLDPRVQGMMMKREREEKGLSLREVARRMGFTAAYICDMELGRRGWNGAKIKAFRLALTGNNSTE